MNTGLSIAILFLSVTTAMAQSGDPLVTDRPDQTESAITIAPGKVQIEAGATVEYDTLMIGAQRDELLVTAPTVLVRIGLLNRLEARVGGDVVHRTIEYDDPIAPGGSTRRTGTDPFELHVGGKYALSEDESGFASALLGGVNLLTSGDPGIVSAELRAALSQDFTSSLSAGVNIGGEWVRDGESGMFYTLVAGLGLSESFGTFIEVYGDMPWQEDAAQAFDTGLTWQTSDVFQLDLAAGFGLTRPAKDAMLGLGFSWRIE